MIYTPGVREPRSRGHARPLLTNSSLRHCPPQPSNPSPLHCKPHRTRALPLALSAYLSPALCSPPLSDEEKAMGRALHSTYVKMMWKRHHVQGRDLQRKLKLKWAAIHALPTPELRREALVIDPFVPSWTRVPTHTPPLKGFHTEQRAIGGDEEADEEAARQAAAKAASATLLDQSANTLKSAAEFGALGSAARSRTGRSDGGVSLLKGLSSAARASAAAPVPAAPKAAPAPAAAAPKGKKK